MRRMLIFTTLLLLAATGCLSARRDDRPFSKDWVHQQNKESELKARIAHINSKGSFLGQKPDTSEPKTDTSNAKRDTSPKRGSDFSIGGNSGFGADMGSGGGKVKYGISW